MRKCYKCNASNNLIRITDESCGSYCEGYHCTCKSICRDCQQNKCGRCGNVNRRDKRVAASCKVCGWENMRERVDGTDTDGQGNWLDGHGQVVGSCKKCVSCGMKTICFNCAVTEATERNSQIEIPPKSLNWY